MALYREIFECIGFRGLISLTGDGGDLGASVTKALFHPIPQHRSSKRCELLSPGFQTFRSLGLGVLNRFSEDA